MRTPNVIDAFNEIDDELTCIYDPGDPLHSPHEGYAVILERVEELWDEIRSRKSIGFERRRRQSACQIAAMAVRFMIDCC